MLVASVQAYLIPGILLAAMVASKWGQIPSSMKKEANEFGGLPGVLVITTIFWPLCLLAAVNKNK